MQSFLPLHSLSLSLSLCFLSPFPPSCTTLSLSPRPVMEDTGMALLDIRVSQAMTEVHQRQRVRRAQG